MDRSSNSSSKHSAIEGRSLKPVPVLAPVTELSEPRSERIDASAMFDMLYDNRFLIGAITLIFTLFGIGYAVLATPVYQSDILIQVEDNSNSATDLLSSVSQMFDIKSAASDEIDILNSRLVLETAVEQTKLYIDVQPKRFPIFGRWWSSRQEGLSKPGFFGHGGYVWAQEQASVPTFNTPATLYGKPFILTAEAGGRYALDAPSADIHAIGRVGTPLSVSSAMGPITIDVASLYAEPGGAFTLTRLSRVGAVDALKKALRISQTDKDSDVIRALLQGTDPKKTSEVLTAIGEQYVHQNVERKSAEAEKSIAFLNTQLPKLKHQLEASESAYNAFRTRNAALDLSEEGTAVLQQSVDAQNKLADLEQKRKELSARFTDNHPAVIAVLNQETVLRQRLAQIETQTRRLPDLEQTELRLQRDVQVNSDLYTSLLNSAEQLRLARAGKTGNARLVDQAVAGELPVKPNRKLVVALSALLGMFSGCLIAWLRGQFASGVLHARDIERDTGLPVYASVQHSKQQRARDALAWSPTHVDKVAVLAHLHSDSIPIESLRSFRTALQFVMLGANNNIVLISGPTPAVGKTFVVANLGAVLAASNKRVLVIDADLRKGDLHRHYGMREGPGLAELIASDAPFDSFVRHAALPRLDVLTRGVVPASPSELLMSPRLARFLGEAAAQYDIVLIDTPPVLAVTDAGVLGRYASATFLVVRQAKTSIAQIKETAKRLNRAGVPLNGVVLNGVKPRPGDRAYGYGSYSYTSSRSHLSEV